MAIKICPVCLEVTEPEATRCGACGASLRGGDTVPAALYMPAEKPAPPKGGSRAHTEGAVWFDDLKRPAPPADLPLAITLRDVLPDPPAPATSPADVPTINFPPIVALDPDAPAPISDEELARRHVVEQLAADRAARAAAKAAKRAAVRRARLGLAANDPLPETEAAVLVVDADDAARSQLVALLEVFGFRVSATADVEEGIERAKAQPFVAAFVDVALDSSDGGAGVDLCQRLKRSDLHADGRVTALVLVCDSSRPSDRVLARLAGCDGSIVKPVTRGSVARQLEACSVALPADARRAAR